MEKKVIKARDVMKTEFMRIDGLSTVREAINAFMENDIEVLIVNKRDENDAFGLVLLSDIIKKVLAKDKAADRVNIYEIMSKPVISIEPDLDVRYCARLFSRFGLSHTFVAEAGEIIGVIGYKQLLGKWFQTDN
jgi:predicted transcriptional regulator